MKILDGRELAGFVKERQRREVAALRAAGVRPRLVIIRDSDNPVIVKYVKLKQRYGEDIGIAVEDVRVTGADEAVQEIARANRDDSVSGIIVQLPLTEVARTDEVVSQIAPEKDVDGLAGGVEDLKLVRDRGVVKNTTRVFDSATATAINWLLTGYDISLSGKKIALVGRGRLVGAPLFRMFRDSGLEVQAFGHDDDLGVLPEFDVVISATGVPGVVKNTMLKPGVVVVDAGTASEGGKLVGDVEPAVYGRDDLAAMTPAKGGVGPLTVAVLFDDVIRAAKMRAEAQG